MGGKTSTSTQSVSIPPEVLARYNAVNARAENVAATPFQPYSFDPSAFVAPLTPTQVAGIQNINTMQGVGFPFYRAGTQMTAAGAAPVGPITGSDIGRYYNPFTAAVAAPTYEALRQQQAQEMQGATANAIRSGAFGGDRSGLVAANLARQQQLGTAQAMAPIFQQGYSQAQEAAQRQQQVDLQNQARMLQAGQQMAGLGTGLQQLGIGGAQAQLAAGTAEQQTQQAGLQALYNQFLQQVGYPFQVAQFLANIAMGTGALSGSTTTTTQPAPFFSDRREKTNVKKLGKGLYAFDYKDDVEAAEREGKPMPPKRVGPMAQEIEKDKPGMVIDVNDYKVVDPGREKAAYGGLMSFMNSLPQDLQQQSMGGGVTPEMAGQGYARGGYIAGGVVSGEDLRGLMRQAENPLEFYGGLKNKAQGVVGAAGYVPKASLHVPRLATASSSGLRAPEPVVKQGMEVLQGLTGKSGLGPQAQEIYRLGQVGLNKAREVTGSDTANQPAAGATKPADTSYRASIDEMPQSSQPLTNLGDLARENLPEMTDIMGAAYGGVVRHGYATDGSVNEPDDDSPISAYATPGPGLQIPDELKNKYEMLKPEKPPQQQSSGLGEVLGLAKMGAQIAMGMPPFFADGGVVPRAGYQNGGEPEGEYTPSDRELGIRTLASEMSGKSWPEAVGIGAVMHNRLKSGKWGNTMSDVVLATKQFEPWNVPGNRNDPMRIDPNSARYRLAEKAYDASASGVDPTGGALNFYAPAAQAALRRPPPDWDKPNLPNKMIGATKFVGGTGLAAGEMSEAPEGLAAPARARGLAAGETEPRAALIRPEMAQGVRAGVSPDLVQKGGQPISQEGTTSNTYDLQRPPQRGVAPIGRESSIGDIANRILPEGIPTSQQFWVPTLSFLGKMLSSKSPYLLGAVGEGLAGGVEGYTTLQKNELDAAKAVMDLVKDRFTRSQDDNGNIVFFDTRTGRTLSASQVESVAAGMLRAQGINPVKYGYGTGAPAQPVSGTGTRPSTTPTAQPQITAPKIPGEAPAESGQPQKPAEQPSWMKIKPDETNLHLIGKSDSQLKEYAAAHPEFYELRGENDPRTIKRSLEQMRTRYDRLINSSDPQQRQQATAIEVRIKDEQKRLDDILSSAIRLQSERNKEIQAADTRAGMQFAEEAEKRMAVYDSNQSLLKRLAEINSRFEAGRSTQLKAELAEWAKEIPIIGPSLAQRIGSAANFDEANKIAVTEAFKVVGEQNMSRAPKAALSQALQAVPGPTLNAGAAYGLIGRGLGALNFDHARDTAYTTKGRGLRPSQFLINWEKDKDNSIDRFIGRAFNEIPVGAGVTMQQRESLARSYPGYKIVPLETRRTEQPAQRPAQQPAQTPAQQPTQQAPARPVPSQSDIDLAKSKPEYRERFIRHFGREP
jgi:hypothetical protein